MRGPAFGGGGGTLLHPVVAIWIILAAILTLSAPRKSVIVFFLMGVMPVPLLQSVNILGAQWQVARLLIVVALVRMSFSPRLASPNRFGKIDKVAMATLVCQAASVVLVYNLSPDAIVNQIAFLIDSLGAYIVIRTFTGDDVERRRALICLAYITMVLALGMAIEQFTLQNVFGQLGGVPIVPEIREGKIRSQGPFRHSLLAGTFAATLIPLFLTLWLDTRSRIHSAVGLVSATVMTICSNSSTPLLAYVGGLSAIAMWPLRAHMKSFRVSLSLTLLALHFAMKAPVWMLIARVDLTGGSSGYHRAMLVDQFIAHLSDWWLIGVKDTASWGWDLWDTQNHYVNVGETGGFLALALFVTMICRCYSALGREREKYIANKRLEWRTWLLGCALTAHVVGFFGVTYFDQSRMGWFMLIAFISGYSSSTVSNRLEAPLTNNRRIYWGDTVIGSEVAPVMPARLRINCARS